jgi:hypothetical protein
VKQQVSASQAGQRVSEKPSARTRYFRDLLVWQKGMKLARAVYTATGRLSDGNLRVFLGQARGSLYELETQIELASDLEYLQAKDAKELLELSREVGRMLNGLIRVLES